MAKGDATLGEALYGLASLVIRNRPRDLSLTAVSTLATLERTGPRRLTELAESEGVTQPSMTAVVTQLARLGLVERRRHPHDGRAVLVATTPAGVDDLRSRRRVGASVFSVLLAKLPPEEAAALRSTVPTLRRLLQLANDGL